MKKELLLLKKLKKVLYILDIMAECVMISIEANKKFGEIQKVC